MATPWDWNYYEFQNFSRVLHAHYNYTTVYRVREENLKIKCISLCSPPWDVNPRPMGYEFDNFEMPPCSFVSQLFRSREENFKHLMHFNYMIHRAPPWSLTQGP